MKAKRDRGVVRMTGNDSAGHTGVEDALSGELRRCRDRLPVRYRVGGWWSSAQPTPMDMLNGGQFAGVGGCGGGPGADAPTGDVGGDTASGDGGGQVA